MLLLLLITLMTLVLFELVGSRRNKQAPDQPERLGGGSVD
jgi:hypothetical protein